MTVHLEKHVDLDSEIYKMNSDSYEELASLSDRYEVSVTETSNI